MLALHAPLAALPAARRREEARAVFERTRTRRATSTSSLPFRERGEPRIVHGGGAAARRRGGADAMKISILVAADISEADEVQRLLAGRHRLDARARRGRGRRRIG